MTEPTRVRSILLAAVLAGVMLLALVASAAANPPSLIQTISGTCDHSSGFASHFGTPVSGNHPNVVESFQGGSATVDFNVLEEEAGPGDIVWDSGSALNANDTPSVTTNCSADTPFSVSFYDVPSTPASFTGAGEASLNLSASLTPFLVSHTAHYVADLSLNQGAVQLSGPCCGGSPQTFASSGTFSLGTLTPGKSSLSVTPLDGPQAQWTVSIHALPVAFTASSSDPAAASGGTPVTFDYGVDGDTTINATVLNAGGAAVRTLASGLSVNAGDHSLTWDGRDGGGGLVPDGVYTLALSSTDPNGNQASTSATVTIDSTPPRAILTSPAVIGPNAAVSVALSDASGVRSGSMDVDGDQDVQEFGAEFASNSADQNGFVYLPLDGWSAGNHTLVVHATDNVGNSGTSTFHFNVSSQVGANGKASCSKRAAEAAMAQVSGAKHLARRIGGPFTKIFSPFKLFCSDVTHDGKRDMTALFGCCTAASPTPLGVFVSAGSHWKLKFSSLRPLIYGLSVKHGDLYEKRPVYRRSDALCCPSSYRRYRLHYSHGHFRTRRVR